MTGNVKEKIYHGISLFCVVLCVWLIGQVAADELFGAGKRQSHVPPVRMTEQAEREPGGFGLTEQQLETELRKYIPQELPLEKLEVSVGQDGTLELQAAVEKKKLLAYFERMDMEVPGGSILTVMGPKQLELSLQVLCSVDDESGLAVLTPGELRLAGNALSPQVMPQNFWDGLSQALNKLLLASGQTFAGLRFDDGTVFLE